MPNASHMSTRRSETETESTTEDTETTASVAPPRKLGYNPDVLNSGSGTRTGRNVPQVPQRLGDSLWRFLTRAGFAAAAKTADGSGFVVYRNTDEWCVDVTYNLTTQEKQLPEEERIACFEDMLKRYARLFADKQHGIYERVNNKAGYPIIRIRSGAPRPDKSL